MFYKRVIGLLLGVWESLKDFTKLTAPYLLHCTVDLFWLQSWCSVTTTSASQSQCRGILDDPTPEWG